MESLVFSESGPRERLHRDSARRSSIVQLLPLLMMGSSQERRRGADCPRKLVESCWPSVCVGASRVSSPLDQHRGQAHSTLLRPTQLGSSGRVQCFESMPTRRSRSYAVRRMAWCFRAWRMDAAQGQFPPIQLETSRSVRAVRGEVSFVRCAMRAPTRGALPANILFASASSESVP